VFAREKHHFHSLSVKNRLKIHFKTNFHDIATTATPVLSTSRVFDGRIYMVLNSEGLVERIEFIARMCERMVYEGMMYEGMGYEGMMCERMVYEGMMYEGMVYEGMMYERMVYEGMMYEEMMYEEMVY
jgi:hypothetical protein